MSELQAKGLVTKQPYQPVIFEYCYVPKNVLSTLSGYNL